MNLLPGWHAGGFIAADSVVELTFIAEAGTASDDNYNLMGSILAGDLLIHLALGSAENSDPPSLNTPDGFTSLETASANPGGGAAVRYLLTYKIADGSEDSAAQDAGSPEELVSAIVLQYRPSRPIVAVTLSDSDFEATSGNPSGIATGAAPYSLWLGAHVGRNSLVSPTISITPDDERTDLMDGPADADVLYKWKVYNPPSTAETVTIDQADGGTANMLVGFAIAVT